MFWYSVYHRTYLLGIGFYVDWAMGWTVRRSNSGGGSEIFLSFQTSRHFGAHPAAYSIGNWAILWRKGGRGLKLAPHLHLAPMLRMSGALLLLPLYAFMSWLGTLKISSFFSYRPFLIKILMAFVNKVCGRIYILHLCRM